jgi:anti-anti-sigma factor
VIVDSGPYGDFEVAVSYASDRVVLGVRGRADRVNAPQLAALLDAVIDRGYASVVLDLAHLEFMDSDGVEVIESGATRLGAFRGVLAIRSAPVAIARSLDIAGLSDMVRFEDPDPANGRLGPEQSSGEPGEPVAVHTPDLARYLRRVTAIPADVDVVDGALRLVVALAQATVDGADGVSVSLQRHGRLMTVAATDQTISDMDTNQYATGEGPCVDASVQGHWFHAESLDQETRWPDFTPKAQELGINAILSNPLMANERPVGALNIYSRTSAAFSSKDQELASIFAFEASIILRDTGVDVSDRQLSWRLDEALRARRLIAQAQGVMMEREGISEEDAFTELRGYSQRDGQPLHERAADIVDSARRLHPGPPIQSGKT